MRTDDSYLPPAPEPMPSTAAAAPNPPTPIRADGNRHQRRVAEKLRRSKEGREQAAWNERMALRRE